MLALVDCNNFYASCERVFRPDLKTAPIVVLSNNDGCIIACSAEAKALGYKVGDVYFKVHRQLQRDNVHVFSSNYALYGDLSDRVMRSLGEHTPLVDVYSIDEAFLDLRGFDKLEAKGRLIKDTIAQWTGIPVSVGIAPTKTLAKLANRIAKKWPDKEGVFVLRTPDPEYLKSIDIGDVWGIGRRLSVRLTPFNVKTAYDLSQMSPRRMRESFSVMVERTVRELQGEPCIPFDEAPSQAKSIMVSRGFKTRITDRVQLEEAISLYASRAGEKAREKQVYANSLTLFIRTSPFADGPKYSKSVNYVFSEPVNDTPSLIKAAIQGLQSIFKPGLDYQKAGVMLTGLVCAPDCQNSLFAHRNGIASDTLMAVMDSINAIHGRDSLRIASSGTDRPWFMAREWLSPCYTTRWNELRRVTV